MKSKLSYTIIRWVVAVSFGSIPLFTLAQNDSADKSKRQSLIYLRYYVKNNQIPYLNVQTKNKTTDGFLPAPKVTVRIYLDQDLSKEALVGEVVTNHAGEAGLVLPPSLSGIWGKQPSHSFFAHTDSSAAFDAASQEVVITLSRLELDTVEGASTRSVVAKLYKKEGDAWVAMPEVDVKLGVKRYGGSLNIGDEDTYATDSTGKVEAEFLREKLPGDKQGKLELAALVDDNEEVGTVETTLTVPWGVVHQYESEFGKRSLWATGRKAPGWLLLMAYTCIIAVWSVIIYLITRIVKIKKLGKATV